jgi:cephalosporin-C deacetylase
MPLIDMPLEELKLYKGRNPKPSDFDSFWEKGLDDMRAVKPELDFKHASFLSRNADCFDMTWTGTGGSRIYAKCLKPKNIKQPIPAVLLFHGYTLYSGDWHEKLSFVSQGFAVFAMDCRGQGGRSEDRGSVSGNTHNGHIIRGLEGRPEDLLYRQIFLDGAQLAGLVMKMDDIDPKRVAAHGASQGGALALACAALEPRIRKAIPFYPFLSDYLRVWEMDLAQTAYNEIRTWFRHFDPTHSRHAEIFNRLGYIDIQHLADRIKADVQMHTGLMDEVCPPSTQFAAYNKMTCNKEMVIYPDFGHESLPGAGDSTLAFLSTL